MANSLGAHPPGPGPSPQPSLVWLAAACALGWVASCADSQVTGRTQVGVTDNSGQSVPAASGPLPATAQVVGRSISVASAQAPLGRRLSWPGTEITFRFVGRELNVQLQQTHDSASHTQNASWNTHFDVIVDGQAAYDALVLTEGPGTYQVAHDLVDGEHTVSLRKRSEAALSGDVQLIGATLDANGTWLAPPPRRERRIEVIGASNEAGFGVHGVDPCTSNDSQANALAAWPVFVADRFGAELHLCAISGQGVLPWSVPTLDADGHPIAGKDIQFPPMPVMWGRADSEDPNDLWEPTLFTPQVVVFDLGGNDYDRGLAQTDEQRNDFVAQYAQFVAQVASAYTQPQIYLLLNSVQDANRRTTLGPDLDKVVAAAKGQGVQRVSVLTLPIYTGSQWGCQRHPTYELQAQNANSIAQQIAQDLSW